MQGMRAAFRSSRWARPSAALLGASTVVVPAVYVMMQEEKKDDRKKVLILGSGWAGFQLARDLDKEKYRVTVVSNQNHFLFTPLLPSTTVGTLEFRCIQEPVRTIPGVKFYQGEAQAIDFKTRTVTCKEVFDKEKFEQHYDYLIVSVGARPNTFNTPGVSEDNQVYFLKQLSDARAIRSRIIQCFEQASYPRLTREEKAKLLSFVVVGGGPTSVEFSSELHDFLQKDVRKWYPDLEDLVTVTLIEASNQILGTFHKRLVEYVYKLLKQRRVNILTQTYITKIEPNVCYLKDGTRLDFGLMVWATGIRPQSLIDSLQVQKGFGGRLLIDPRLRLLGAKQPEGTSGASYVPGVFALGDCAVDATGPLPPLAQVARQQARYLAKVLNQHPNPSHDEDIKPFEYTHMGSLAYLGMWQGVMDTTKIKQHGEKEEGTVIQGLAAWAIWRSAYWTRSVSAVNKMLIPMYWFKSFVFGRDISKF